MFEKFIRIMNNGKIYSQYELSEQLGISPETLQSYIEYLFKKGLISRISMETEQNKCSGRCNNCSGCSMKNTPSNAPVLWELKDKDSINIKSIK